MDTVESTLGAPTAEELAAARVKEPPPEGEEISRQAGMSVH